MKHIIAFSGGLGSFFTAKRVIEKHGKENVLLKFTDTLIEDQDLYRFLIESSNHLYGITDTSALDKVKDMPPFDALEERAEFIKALAKEAHEINPAFHWLIDGRNIWETFKDDRFLGNSRLAPCTKNLKQKTAKKWIKDNFKPDECILYLGIDWTEEHRTTAPRKHWNPYKVDYPLLEPPLLDKEQMKRELAAINIELPYLYKLGFSHNNCGGLCVRGGQGHWAQVLEYLPDRYDLAEKKEKELQDYLQKPVTHLTRTVNGQQEPLPLETLRKEYQERPQQLDLFDIGGCGCFVTYD